MNEDRKLQIEWFKRGYRDGKTLTHRKGIMSPREASDMNPSLPGGIVEHYLNGFADGFAGDDFRLKLIS